MKKLIFALTLISSQAFAFNLKEVSGKYSAKYDSVPINSVITIESNGTINLVEKSVHGAPLVCNGKAKVKNNKITSNVKCVNGFTFEQVVNLTNVKNLNEFTAPVYSTLFGQEVMVSFKRIQ